jgi:hypothetical protein
LLKILQDYDRYKLIIIKNGFTYGFHLSCKGIPCSKVSRNHKSAF